MKIIFSVLIFVAVAAHANAKKRCYPVPTPVVDPPAPVCPQNEVYSDCGANGCQATCANPTLPQVCRATCMAGCVCKEGYLRDANNKCVLAKKCPQIGDPPVEQCPKKHEVYNTCGTRCPLTCDNYKNPPSCVKMCVKGCFCESGYVRNSDGDCIKREDCPNTQCQKFEIFSDCAPEACKKTCDTLNTACRAPCVTGCKCPEGQVYRDDNRDACIVPEECPQVVVDPPEPEPPVPEPDLTPAPPLPPACAKTHESFTDCGSACPLTCDNINGPPKACAAVCVVGCFCDEGYIRNSNGDCVLKEECPVVVVDPPVQKCKKAHESFTTCGSACPLTCENPTRGVCTKQCVTGCFCDDGYVRDNNGDCVVVEDCPKPKCGKHETYGDCGASPCQATCENPNLPMMCKAACRPGCGCDEGYVRDSDRNCVLLKKCPAALKCEDNEDYVACSTLCGEATCDSEARYCGLGCEPRCHCKKGYVRNAKNKCIKATTCPTPNPVNVEEVSDR